MPENHKHLIEENNNNKDKRKGILRITGSDEVERKNKVETLCFCNIKGGLEKSLDLQLDKLSKLYGKNWPKSEFDKNTLAVVSSDGARHQVAIEGDVNVMCFNITLVNNRLLQLGHTTTQSVNMLTFKQLAADEKSYIVIAAYDETHKERNVF